MKKLNHEEPQTPDEPPSWEDLVGLFDDPDSPGDVSAHVDEYLAETVENEDHGQTMIEKSVG